MKYIIFCLFLTFIAGEILPQSNWEYKNPTLFANEIFYAQLDNDYDYFSGSNGLIAQIDSNDNIVRRSGEDINKKYISFYYKENKAWFIEYLANSQINKFDIYYSENYGENKRKISEINSQITAPNYFSPSNLKIKFFNDKVGLMWNSVIVKTTDGGNSWNNIPISEGNFLRECSILNDSTYFYYTSTYQGTKFYKTSNSGLNWNLISSFSQSFEFISGFKYIDFETAYFPTKNGVYKTTNGGLKFNRILSTEVGNTSKLTVDKENIYYTKSGLTNTEIFISNDAGNTWIVKNLNIGEIKSYSNNQKVILTGRLGIKRIILKSIDFGNSFYEVNKRRINYYDFFTLDNKFSWYVDSFNNQTIIHRTTNGSNTFTSNNLNIPSIHKIYFESPQTGYISSSNNLFKSIDSGKTWNLIFTASNLIREIKSFKNKNIFLFLDGNISVTSSDNFVTYSTNIALPENYYCSNIRYSKNYIFLCHSTTSGYQGIHRSSDFGKSFNNLGSNGYQINDISMANDSIGYMWIANLPHNYIVRTNNGCLSWSILQISSYSYEYPILDSKGSDTLIMGLSNGLVKYTTNRGLNWKEYILPEQPQKLKISDSSIYAYSSNYIIKLNSDITTNITSNTEILDSYDLHQNFPNPFNPATKISFTINNKSKISLLVYDISGKLIMELINNQSFQKGTHSIEFDGSHLSSGIYFYKLETENFSSTKKMMLIK